MDVEYIPLETNDEFLTQGLVRAVGKEIVVVVNNVTVSDGDIFIFDRNGKGVRKINRKGQGNGEYLAFSRITLDDEKGELFVNDYMSNRIMVYDLEGNFKRSLAYKEGYYYSTIYNFNREYLICDNGAMNADRTPNRDPLILISKQDGSVVREIEIPFEEKRTIIMTSQYGTDGIYVVRPPSVNYPVVPYFEGCLLVDPSADTLYSYSADHTLTPFIVRTPSIRSMDPEVFLFPGVLTSRYYFLQTVKKVYDFAAGEGFPNVSLAYDRQEKKIYEVTVYNDDYSDKKPVDMMTTPVNTEIATWQRLEAPDLLEAYGKGELKGRLAEIVAGMDEEDNAVIMLLKYKK
jgi:hypothetical protein